MPDITPQDITGSTAESDTGAQAADQDVDLGQIPATQAEEVGMLSLRYVDGSPVLVVSGGPAIPGLLAVVNSDGTAVAAYAAQAPATPAQTAATGARARSLDIQVPDYKIDDVIQAAPRP